MPEKPESWLERDRKRDPQYHERILSVTCPKCSALTGEYCHTSSGAVAHYHVPRKQTMPKE